MPEEIVKSSAIVIATGDEVKVFRNLEEIPPELRKKLSESTSSQNSGTVLIANRGGREKMRRALESLVESAAEETRGAPARSGRSIRRWAEAAGGVLAGLLTWLLLKRFF